MNTENPVGQLLSPELARELIARGVWRRIEGHGISVLVARRIDVVSPATGRVTEDARPMWASKEAALSGSFADSPILAIEVSGTNGQTYGPFDGPEDAARYIVENLM